MACINVLQRMFPRSQAFPKQSIGILPARDRVRKVDLATSQLVGVPPPFNVRLENFLHGQPLRLLGCWCASMPPLPPGDEPGAAAPLWDIEVWTAAQWEARGVAESNAQQTRLEVL